MSVLIFGYFNTATVFNDKACARACVVTRYRSWWSFSQSFGLILPSAEHSHGLLMISSPHFSCSSFCNVRRRGNNVGESGSTVFYLRGQSRIFLSRFTRNTGSHLLLEVLRCVTFLHLESGPMFIASGRITMLFTTSVSNFMAVVLLFVSAMALAGDSQLHFRCHVRPTDLVLDNHVGQRR